MIPTLEYLNPDAMEPDDLAVVARQLHRLAYYCSAKAAAMRTRAAGDIVAALTAEKNCDALYKKLPPEWRW